MPASDSSSPKRTRRRKKEVAEPAPLLSLAPAESAASTFSEPPLEVMPGELKTVAPDAMASDPMAKLKRRRTTPRRRAAGEVPPILFAAPPPPLPPDDEAPSPLGESAPSNDVAPEPASELVAKAPSLKPAPAPATAPAPAPRAKKPWPTAARLALTAFAAFLGGAGGHFAAAFLPSVRSVHVEPTCAGEPAPAPHAAAEHH